MIARFLLLALVTAQIAIAQSSPLQTLDGLLAAPPSATAAQTADDAVSFFLDHLKSPLLQDLPKTTIRQRLTEMQLQFISGNQPGIPEVALVEACNSWDSIVGLSDRMEQSAAALHEYRVAMSEISPHLFVRGSTGQVLYTASPLEAFYILDLCMAEGGIPQVAHGQQVVNTNLLDTQASEDAAALAQYYSRTAAQARVAQVISILKFAGLD